MADQHETGTRQQSGLDFKLMALGYRIRDWRLPRIDILREAGIKPGCRVLDYGCGPGSYILPLAQLVGESGQIYAIDINPLAIRTVQKIAARNRLENVRTVLTGCRTGLPSGSMDTVLLYDILHDLADAQGVLSEISRVLKTQGILSVSDHHLKDAELVSLITGSGLFRLVSKQKWTHSFSKKNR